MSDTFKAILISRDADEKQSVAVTELTDADLMEGDVTVAVEATHRQLQGRAGDHRQGAGGAALPAGSGHRLRRHGDRLAEPGLERGRQGHPQWLGRRRDASRRLCRARPGQRRLAGAAAARAWAPHDAMAIGTAGYTAMLAVMALERHGITPRSRPGGGHRRRRRRRLRRGLAPVPARLPCHRLDRPASREPTT